MQETSNPNAGQIPVNSRDESPELANEDDVRAQRETR
jgi:hypothetical protein